MVSNRKSALFSDLKETEKSAMIRVFPWAKDTGRCLFFIGKLLS
ncbi:hypothetical protein D922_02800 [Enterococcus faecalis 06-MB-DW-09]|nr:hypothetical protein D931_02759 [Enterococcus faecium 13.SD.W.09]EPH90963.1 hypothetical protein D922_02800 [Enterococcus faecalis 06-MB-DW-09]